MNRYLSKFLKRALLRVGVLVFSALGFQANVLGSDTSQTNPLRVPLADQILVESLSSDEFDLLRTVDDEEEYEILQSRIRKASYAVYRTQRDGQNTQVAFVEITRRNDYGWSDEAGEWTLIDSEELVSVESRPSSNRFAHHENTKDLHFYAQKVRYFNDVRRAFKELESSDKDEVQKREDTSSERPGTIILLSEPNRLVIKMVPNPA